MASTSVMPSVVMSLVRTRDAEGEGGQDRELVSCVTAAHIEGGIRLGVAGGLSPSQSLGKADTTDVASEKDVVAGAVEDGAAWPARDPMPALHAGCGSTKMPPPTAASKYKSTRS